MVEFIFLFSAIYAITIAFTWLDKKLELGLAINWDWLNGQSTGTTSKPDPSTQQIQQLTERVNALETIITDNKYQLDEQLRKM